MIHCVSIEGLGPDTTKRRTPSMESNSVTAFEPGPRIFAHRAISNSRCERNGAYGFDFSVYEGNDEEFRKGLELVSSKIVETGVTAYVPLLCIWLYLFT